MDCPGKAGWNSRVPLGLARDRREVSSFDAMLRTRMRCQLLTSTSGIAYVTDSGNSTIATVETAEAIANPKISSEMVEACPTFGDVSCNVENVSVIELRLRSDRSFPGCVAYRDKGEDVE